MSRSGGSKAAGIAISRMSAWDLTLSRCRKLFSEQPVIADPLGSSLSHLSTVILRVTVHTCMCGPLLQVIYFKILVYTWCNTITGHFRRKGVRDPSGPYERVTSHPQGVNTTKENNNKTKRDSEQHMIKYCRSINFFLSQG